MSNTTPKRVNNIDDLDHYNLYTAGRIDEYNNLLHAYWEDHHIPYHFLFYRYYDAIATLESMYRMLKEMLEETTQERDEARENFQIARRFIEAEKRLNLITDYYAPREVPDTRTNNTFKDNFEAAREAYERISGKGY